MKLLGLITKREHDEIVAKERGRTYDALSDASLFGECLDIIRSHCKQVGVQTAFADDAVAVVVQRLQSAEARLAVFTAPRTRGPGGRFLSTRPVGEMGEGGNA